MRKVLNLAHYAVSAKLGNEVFRFEAREVKLLPAHLVETPEFSRFSKLKNLGPDHTPIEIKSPEPEKVTVVDDTTKVQDVIDIEPEPETKPKRRRKQK